MRTQADENYLKEIYTLEQVHGQASTTMLAERLDCSPATVTGMLKKLARSGWVSYTPYQGVTLTTSGREIAVEMIRHHRLIEAYLAQALQVPWERVHGEAEKLEHAISEYLEERIDSALGHPTVDPHGSPIPSREGDLPARNQLRLADLEQGSHAEVVEVDDHDPQLLVHLDELHLHPNTVITVTAVEPLDGLITIQSGGESHIIGRTTANQVFVKRK